MIFSIKVFVTLLVYLKIPEVAIFRWLACLKSPCFFRILVLVHCPPTVCLNPSPSLLANRGRLWTFDLNQSQVRGRYNCIRDIRRSLCRPFCACVLLSWSEHMLSPSWSREIALSRFSVCCVSIYSTRGLLIPTKGIHYVVFLKKWIWSTFLIWFGNSYNDSAWSIKCMQVLYEAAYEAIVCWQPYLQIIRKVYLMLTS
jgi:hypothetical protein